MHAIGLRVRKASSIAGEFRTEAKSRNAAAENREKRAKWEIGNQRAKFRTGVACALTLILQRPKNEGIEITKEAVETDRRRIEGYAVADTIGLDHHRLRLLRDREWVGIHPASKHLRLERFDSAQSSLRPRATAIFSAMIARPIFPPDSRSGFSLIFSMDAASMHRRCYFSFFIWLLEGKNLGQEMLMDTFQVRILFVQFLAGRKQKMSSHAAFIIVYEFVRIHVRFMRFCGDFAGVNH